jgi:hypothetical protein
MTCTGEDPESRIAFKEISSKKDFSELIAPSCPG